MKKFLKELFLIVLIIFIALDLKIYTPMLRLFDMVFPQLFFCTEANVVSINEEIVRMGKGTFYDKYITIEYMTDNKKHISELYYRGYDTEGSNISIKGLKACPTIIFRVTSGMPTLGEIVSMILLLGAVVIFFRIKWYEPDKVVKTDKSLIASTKEKLPNLFLFLKKNNSLELFDEISMTQEKKNLNDLCELGLYFDEYMDSKIINETESEWAINHKKDYIIIGRKDSKVILYKIDEGFIYTFDEHTNRYTFEAGGLIKYLKMHKCWE